MAHATANKKVRKVKATSHPTYKTQPLAKGHMPIRRETCTEEACPLRRGPKDQAAEPRTGPPTPTEKDAFQTASCGRWPRCGRAQSLSRLYTVGGWEVGWGHRPCEAAIANRHQTPKCPRRAHIGQGPSPSSGTASAGVGHGAALAEDLLRLLEPPCGCQPPPSSCVSSACWCGGGAGIQPHLDQTSGRTRVTAGSSSARRLGGASCKAQGSRRHDARVTRGRECGSGARTGRRVPVATEAERIAAYKPRDQ